MPNLNRRMLLRGTLGGAAVGMALPLLDCFLDGNGTAMAATGEAIPVRFGTWIWGCGIVPERWVPTSEGRHYVMPVDLVPLERHRDRLAILSGFDVKSDCVGDDPHLAGCLGVRTGSTVPVARSRATLDMLIGEKTGNGTRFRSLELSASGVQRSYSWRAGSPKRSETSPTALYRRLFGEGLLDPGDPASGTETGMLAERSVLSAVTQDRQKLMSRVGAQDRHRLDEYFTSVRHIESQLALHSNAGASISSPVLTSSDETAVPWGMGEGMETHRLMSGLLAAALQVDQTRIFNLMLSDPASRLWRDESSATQSMFAWGEFLDAIDAIPEGDGTLLGNCLILAHSGCSAAGAHARDGIPVMVAGNAGGGVRTGFHLSGGGQSIARIGLTMQQAMGLDTECWGHGAMETDRTIRELLA